MESEAGEIHSFNERKNDKRLEGRVEVGIGRFTLETHQKGFIKRLRTCVGTPVGVQQLTPMPVLNTGSL